VPHKWAWHTIDASGTRAPARAAPQKKWASERAILFDADLLPRHRRRASPLATRASSAKQLAMRKVASAPSSNAEYHIFVAEALQCKRLQFRLRTQVDRQFWRRNPDIPVAGVRTYGLTVGVAFAAAVAQRRTQWTRSRTMHRPASRPFQFAHRPLPHGRVAHVQREGCQLLGSAGDRRSLRACLERTADRLPADRDCFTRHACYAQPIASSRPRIGALANLAWLSMPGPNF
jgi:hypothetical protein